MHSSRCTFSQYGSMSEDSIEERMAEEDAYSVLIPRGSIEEEKSKVVMQGYDFDFVNGLESKYECPICLNCQREPMQTICGHRFCKPCILTWLRKGRNNCPADNEIITEDNLFLDIIAKREISALLVRCPNKENGCSSVIEIGKVDQHLTSCPFALIKCPNECGVSILNRDLESHMLDDCLRRMIKCKLCSMNFPLSGQQSHFAICPMVPIPCECGELVPREELEYHKAAVCNSVDVHCQYVDMGCNEKMKREDINAHMQSNAPNHLDMVTTAFKQLEAAVGNCLNERNTDSISRWLNQAGDNSPEIDEVYLERPFIPPPSLAAAPEHLRNLFEKNVHLEQKSRELELKLEGCKRQLRKSEQTCETLTNKLADVEGRFCNGVQYWRINEFTKLRHDAVAGLNHVLHSPGFYTSPYGFKVCLRLNVQQCDNSAYVSLFIHLMKGEFDDLLQWPFSGKITMSILDLFDRSENKHDISETMHTKPGLTAFRKPTSERNPKGFGYTEFVTVDTLLRGPFIKDDSIVVRAVVTI
uniref:Uncharacterized protein n=1 Tax=Strigamia maritima TaxID=126957 RepID=T1JE02_STRMM